MTKFEAGELLASRYRLEGPIGEGAAGLVLAAHDELLDRAVVVKIVRGASRLSGESAARLEREARAAARIGHPHIVQVLDLGRTDDGWPFLVMERLRGETLDALLLDRDQLDVTLAIELHLQLLDGLAAAHDAGVLHRDIKPPNVIVSWLDGDRPFVKLLDFGLAALEDASAQKLTQTGAVVGSPAYLAPELLMGQQASTRVDVYATGVSLYECLAGRAPFHAPSPQALRGQILGQDPPPLSTLRADVPAALSALVERAMSKDPEARFASARAMRDALLGVRSGAIETARSPASAVAEPGRAVPRRQTLRPLWIAASLLVVAVSIGAASMAIDLTPADAAPSEARVRAPADPGPALSPPPTTGPVPVVAALEEPEAAVEQAQPDTAAPPPAPPRASRARESRSEEAATRSAAVAPPTQPSPPRVGESLLDPFEDL